MTSLGTVSRQASNPPLESYQRAGECTLPLTVLKPPKCLMLSTLARLLLASDLPAPSINSVGGASSAVVESSTNPTDHADQHVCQYHESDSATSISTGM